MLPTTIPSNYPHSIFFIKRAQLCQTQQLPWILFRDSGALRLQAPYTTVTKGVCLKKNLDEKPPPAAPPAPRAGLQSSSHRMQLTHNQEAVSGTRDGAQ